MKELLAIIAALLAVGGNVPYVRDILRRRVQPHPYTWLVGAIVSAIIFFGQLQKGAGVGALPTGVSDLFTICIFLLSLRYGYTHIRRVDSLFLVAALAGIIPWFLTDDPTLSVGIAVAIDLVALGPTLRKSWRDPGSESPVLYGFNVLRHILALFSLQAYNLVTMLHSIAMIIANATLTGLILGGKHSQKSAP